MKIIIYQQNLAQIGGIETAIYYLANNLKKYHDVTFLYDIADPFQLDRLDVVKIKRNPKDKYFADVLLKMSAFGSPDNVYAEKYVQCIHACYSELNDYKYFKWFKTDVHLAISEEAKESFLKLFPNEKVDVVPNIVPKFPKRKKKNNEKLTLVSATRLTVEKGYSRMLKLVCELEKETDFDWIIYTNNKKLEFENKHFILKQPKLNILDELRNADYVVQLSDTESFCYTIHESLSLGTPVIVSDWSGIRKTVKDGVNGYVLDMNMKNCKVSEIVNNIPNGFNYKPAATIKDWLKYFDSINIKKIKVKALIDFTDMKEGVSRKQGDVFEVTERRYEEINKCEYSNIRNISMVELIK